MTELTNLLFIFVAGLFASLLYAEAYVTLDHISHVIVRFASRHMPSNLSDRFEEEWTGVLNETPGNLAKIGFALNCCIAALCTSKSDASAVPEDDEYSDISNAHAIVGAGNTVAEKLAANFLDTTNNGNIYAFKVRNKALEAMLEKQARKQQYSPNYSLTDITDVVGLRLLTLTQSELCETGMQVVNSIIDDKIGLLDADSIESVIIQSGGDLTAEEISKFHDELVDVGIQPRLIYTKSTSDIGYSGITIAARTNITPESYVPKGYLVPAEIQIRTVLEDAKDNIDHMHRYVGRRAMRPSS